MTKEELYKSDIKRVTKMHPSLHPAVINGKVVPCIGQNCAYCDLNAPPYYGECNDCNDAYEKWLSEEAELDKRKQERMVTRTVSYAKGEEVVHYDMLYGFSRHDVLEKLYHYEQEEEEKAK